MFSQQQQQRAHHHTRDEIIIIADTLTHYIFTADKQLISLYLTGVRATTETRHYTLIRREIQSRTVFRGAVVHTRGQRNMITHTRYGLKTKPTITTVY